MRHTKVWMLIILFISVLVVSCNKEPEGDPPVAGFTADKTAVATGESIQFTDNSTESPTSWSWDFGDGNNSTSQNPTHSYDTEGTFSVTLTATNEFGSDDVTMTDYITVTTAASESEILISYLESTSSPYGKYYVNTDMPAIKSAEAVKTLMATNEEYIIDIRAAADYDTAHIEGAVNLGAGSVLNHIQTVDSVSNYTDIIIVCYTGQTAAWLTSLLRLAGIDNVYSMKWGMCSWHDDFASRWKNAVSNSAAALDFDQVAVDKGPEGDLPSLSTGFDTGADILEARLDVVLAEGFGAAAVSKSAVLDHKDDYYIVNYWPAAEYADPGHIIGARQYEPKQDIALDAALKTLPTDKTIVVYCYTGQNSANLAAYLRLVGYDAKSLTFGTNGMIYDLMTKSKWVDTEVKGYDYWYSPPAP